MSNRSLFDLIIQKEIKPLKTSSTDLVEGDRGTMLLFRVCMLKETTETNQKPCFPLRSSYFLTLDTLIGPHQVTIT